MPNPIRIYRLDDTDWWAGESLQACIDEARSQCGAGSYCDAEDEGQEVSDAEMQQLIYVDESDGAQPPIERTFAEQLAREVADGGGFPRLFASTDW